MNSRRDKLCLWQSESTASTTITCKVNGRQYVGSAAHVRNRWATHRWAYCAAESTQNRHLQADWTEHGRACVSSCSGHRLRSVDRELRLDAEHAAYLGTGSMATWQCQYDVHPNARNRAGAELADEHRAGPAGQSRGTEGQADQPRAPLPRHQLRRARRRVRHPSKALTPDGCRRADGGARHTRRDLGKPKTAGAARLGASALVKRTLSRVTRSGEIRCRLAAGGKRPRHLGPEYGVITATISHDQAGSAPGT